MYSCTINTRQKLTVEPQVGYEVAEKLKWNPYHHHSYCYHHLFTTNVHSYCEFICSMTIPNYLLSQTSLLTPRAARPLFTDFLQDFFGLLSGQQTGTLTPLSHFFSLHVKTILVSRFWEHFSVLQLCIFLLLLHHVYSVHSSSWWY